MTDLQHDEITRNVAPNGYGVGVFPNPYADQCKEWRRRKDFCGLIRMLTDKIEMLFEPRFITPPETSEAIASIITMTDARQVLEIGTHTGFTTLHMLMAIVGKPGARVTSVDCRPAHDKAFFGRPEITPWFRHVEGWTPGILETLQGTIFDLVFVDSDHSVDHCEKELASLINLTRTGTVFLFHDCPKRQTPNHAPDSEGIIFRWLHEKVAQGYFRGTVLPTCEQLDCLMEYGAGYPQDCNPSLGCFVRL